MRRFHLLPVALLILTTLTAASPVTNSNRLSPTVPFIARQVPAANSSMPLFLPVNSQHVPDNNWDPAIPTPTGPCAKPKPSYCQMKYKGLWTAVTVAYPDKDPVAAQKLIGFVKNWIHATPTGWKAVGDGCAGSIVTFTVPIQAESVDMSNAIQFSTSYVDSSICTMS